MSTSTKDLLAKIRTAKTAVSVADDQLGEVLANEKILPRAQKRIINQVVDDAFAKLRAAGDDLARLEELLAADEE
jgi:hypothetical protein